MGSSYLTIAPTKQRHARCPVCEGSQRAHGRWRRGGDWQKALDCYERARHRLAPALGEKHKCLGRISRGIGEASASTRCVLSVVFGALRYVLHCPLCFRTVSLCQW